MLVLLHGRGSNMKDLQILEEVLPPRRGVLVTPQGPHAGAPWGYGPGWAWYHHLGEDRVEPDSLARSLEELEKLVGSLEKETKIRPGPLVLGGFSQGGTMALAYAMTHPGEAAAVAVLSGFLMNRASLDAGPKALGHTPIFWGHGIQDTSVPFSLAVEGRRRIMDADGNLATRDYTMGHWVIPQEIADLRAWLEKSIPGWSREGARTLPAGESGEL